MSMNYQFMSKIPDRTTRRKPQYTARTWYPVPFCCLYKIPLEPILRILISLTFAAIDVSATNDWTLFDSKGEISTDNASSFQHATIFFMFAVLGFAEVMESQRKLQLPHAIPHIILSMNYLAIAVVHYQSSFDKNLIIKGHCQLLLLAAGLAGFITAVESFQTRIFALSFAKCFFTILQGTWLFQTAFATSSSKSWKTTKGNANLIPLTFLWHISALLIICFVVHCILLCAVNRYKKKQDALYSGHDSRRKIDEDTIPLGIVVNGNMLYDEDTSDIDTLYP